MKSITIHNFDDELERSLLKYASLQGLSLNSSVKKLLRKVLGLNGGRKEDFSDLCGVMSKKESSLINKALEDFEIIDSES